MENITVGSGVAQAACDASPVESCYGLIDENLISDIDSMESELPEESEETSTELVQADDGAIVVPEENIQNHEDSEVEEFSANVEEHSTPPTPSQTVEHPDQTTAGSVSFPIEKIKEGAESLQEIPQQQNKKTYDKIAAILALSKEQYTAETYTDCIDAINEFAVISELVVSSAFTMATGHRFDEGTIMNVAKEMDKAVHNDGKWEERAKRFPYSKQTRCKYMRIARMRGLQPYFFLGIELIDTALRAIKKEGIDKTETCDDIKVLLEKHGRECDLSLPHTELKSSVESVCDLVLNVDKDGDDSADTDDGKGGDTAPDNSGVDATDNDNNTTGDKETDSASANVTDEDSDSTDENNNPSDVDEDSNKSISNNVSEDSGDSDDSVDSEDEESEAEAVLRRLMNNDSLNRQCAKVITTSEEIIEYKLPQDKFDTYILEEAITALTEVKEYLTY